MATRTKSGWWLFPCPAPHGFSRWRKDSGHFLQVSTPVPEPETMKIMMDKSPKSWIVCAVTPDFFPRSLCTTGSIPCGMATSNCSTLLHLAPLSSFELSLAGTRLPSTPLLPTDASCTGAAFQHNVLEPRLPLFQSHISKPCLGRTGKGTGSGNRGQGPQGWSQQSPQWRVRQNDTLPGMHSPCLPPETMPAVMTCVVRNSNLAISKQCELRPLSTARTPGKDMMQLKCKRSMNQQLAGWDPPNLHLSFRSQATVQWWAVSSEKQWARKSTVLEGH